MLNRLKNFFIINNFCSFNKIYFKKNDAKSKAKETFKKKCDQISMFVHSNDIVIRDNNK